jgi:hypothetical protein
MTSNFEYEYVRGADGRILERHILPNIKNSTVEAGTIVLLNHEDELSWTDVQTAFDGAQNVEISGGFFGINAPEEALEFSSMLLQNQLDRDASLATVEMTVLTEESDHLEAEILEMGIFQTVILAFASSLMTISCDFQGVRSEHIINIHCDAHSLTISLAQFYGESAPGRPST